MELEDPLHASAAYKSYPKHKQAATPSEQGRACAEHFKQSKEDEQTWSSLWQ